MVIEIQPEDEKIITEKLRTGAFRSIDELIHRALILLADPKPESSSISFHAQSKKSLAELFAESPFKGLAMDFEKFSDTSSDL